MTKTAVTEQITHRWYTRPVLFVTDVNRAVRFYIDMLGFEKDWHEGDGAGGVAKSIARDARSSFARMPREETRRACSWH
jgi:catechol 2,3-dioxygenase-like lactoylglutathione lyase family enzyme